jgi:alpha-galactosidase
MILKLNRTSAAPLAFSLVLACAVTNCIRAQSSNVSYEKTVVVNVDSTTGEITLRWRDGSELHGLTSNVTLTDGRLLTTDAYTRHKVINGAHEITIEHTKLGLPTLIQRVYISAEGPWVEIQAELDSSTIPIATNRFVAVQVQGERSFQTVHQDVLRVLHVPYDNDMWFRFNAVALDQPDQRVTSNEVTTIYDNASRRGFVFGSLTHDVWKTSLTIQAENGSLKDLEVFGGLQGQLGERSDTHDFVAHGIVSGRKVLSPRVMVGEFDDWRSGMDAYGKRNAELHPPLAWAGPRPLGWNSWAAYADKINRQRYIASAQFVHDKLSPEGFSRKVVYINFDAFWSSLDGVALEDAMGTVKSMKSGDGAVFEPGIYWTPFAAWGGDLDAFVEGTNGKYRYRDILLKGPDGAFLPTVDGGKPIDPTAPGTRLRTQFYIDTLAKMGFKYLKLDFLSHGALEGAHADPAIQTGTEAYNLGMQDVVKANAGRMFLSLSIAPLFPSGYGHARRLSCDTKGHISGKDQSTEYMLNALTYAWWTDESLYIIDPDHIPLGTKADEGARNLVEAQSRLLSTIISGGMILDSTRLADDPDGQAMALQVYSNRALMQVADQGKVFRPVEGDTGDAATKIFARESARGYYIAVFNYDDKEKHTIEVNLDRIDPKFKGSVARDVASGASAPMSGSNIAVDLAPSESRLIEVFGTNEGMRNESRPRTAK